MWICLHLHIWSICSRSEQFIVQNILRISHYLYFVPSIFICAHDSIIFASHFPRSVHVFTDNVFVLCLLGGQTKSENERHHLFQISWYTHVSSAEICTINCVLYLIVAQLLIMLCFDHFFNGSFFVLKLCPTPYLSWWVTQINIWEDNQML